jgi:hypothetical protein
MVTAQEYADQLFEEWSKMGQDDLKVMPLTNEPEPEKETDATLLL